MAAQAGTQSVADLEGAELTPPLGWRSDSVTHGNSWYVTTYCIIATSSPVFLFKYVKHGTDNIHNDEFLTALECTKFVFGRGSLQCSCDLLAGLRGLFLRGEEGRKGRYGPFPQISGSVSDN